MSREKKFTPGPWVRSEYYSDGADPLDKDGFGIADIPKTQIKEDHPDNKHWSESSDFHREISQSEFMANANLIAAAPELLEALENLENDDGKSMPESAWKLVQSAIAKAYGEQEKVEIVDVKEKEYFTCPHCGGGHITRAFHRCIDCKALLKWIRPDQQGKEDG